MSQNINLFNPAFRKEELAFSFKALAAGLVVTLLALGAIHSYLHLVAKGLAVELNLAQGVLNAQLKYSERLKQHTATRKQDTRLDAEIAQLENELKQAREAMDALKGGALGSQDGFAEYLRAFSRQSLNGLWLTGLAIGGSGEIEIRGRVLSPELVPSYIQRLNREKVLAGRSFARLEMARPKPEAEKAKGEGKDAKKEARAPRYLEFSLTTAETSRAEKAR